MSAHARTASRGGPAAASSGSKRTYFEQQRELLMGEIATSFEQVLANINKLNRSLEAVITVGNEFSAVEALWSQFEGVMHKEEAGESEAGGEGDAAPEGEHDGEHDGETEPDSHVEQ